MVLDAPWWNAHLPEAVEHVHRGLNPGVLVALSFAESGFDCIPPGLCRAFLGGDGAEGERAFNAFVTRFGPASALHVAWQGDDWRRPFR